MGKGRILIIDDSVTLLAKVKERLTREGYEVVTSSKAVGNSELLLGTDVVLIDFHMPGFSGASALRGLRKAAEVFGQSDTIFSLFTSDDVEAANYREHGFDKVVTDKGDIDAVALQVDALFASLSIRKAIAAGTLPSEG
ncbi:MAG TPA: response regulator [Labilithrix sp.]|jgi:DNA-binding response OmpR family regulator|nr:response regulator [Labilithrix sp.]